MKRDSYYTKRLKEGDFAAFQYLYEEWSPKLFNFVLRISNNDKYHAEDIVQSVFVRIWEMRSNINLEKNFESFIYAIAKNMIINIHRHKMYEYLYEEEVKRLHEDYHQQNETFIDSSFDTNYLENIIDKYIEELPPIRRKIFVLSRKSFYTNQQIAEELNISVHTVESQMTKAISFLRSKLAKYLSAILLFI